MLCGCFSFRILDISKFCSLIIIIIIIISLLENVSLHVSPSNLMDFPLFGVCPSNKHCPSARCAYAANAVGKDLDILAIGAISLNHIHTHQPKIVMFSLPLFIFGLLFTFSV
jgi:hypothetical protein